MRRMDVPYVVSVLVGAFLAVGLFFSLTPRLKSPSAVTPEFPEEFPRPDIAQVAVPPERTDTGLNSRPIAVQSESGHPGSLPQTIVPGAKSSAQSQPDRRVLPVRPASRRTPGLPARTGREKTTGGVAQLTPPQAPPDSGGSGIVQTPAPSPDEQGPRYIIQVGPVADQERAAEIVRQLALAGFQAKVTSRDEPGPPRFQVVSEMVPLTVAERRAGALIDLGFHPQVQRLAAGFARLRFGSFASQREAELLARRVRTTGYSFAAAVREGGNVYVITLGPHRQDTVEAIQGVLRSRFRWMLPVTVSPAY